MDHLCKVTTQVLVDIKRNEAIPFTFVTHVTH